LAELPFEGHDSMTRLTLAALALTGALAFAGPVLAQGSIGGPAKHTGIGGPAKPTSAVAPSQKVGTVTVPQTAQSSCATCGKKSLGKK
jgi:hypothetical protein